MYPRPVAIVDIDTTIANNDHRARFLVSTCARCGTPVGTTHRARCPSCGSDKHKTPQHCWDLFLDPAEVLKDTVQPHALDVLNAMRRHGWHIVFLTGRGERLRQVTSEWLLDNVNRQASEALLMRPAGSDGVPASVCKERLFTDYVKHKGLGSSVFWFFEDDSHVLSTWAKYGIVMVCPTAWETMNPVVDTTVEPAWKR